MHNALNHWHANIPLLASSHLSCSPPSPRPPRDVSIRPAAPCHIANSRPFRSSVDSDLSSRSRDNRGRKRAPMTKADRLGISSEARSAWARFTLLLTGFTVTRGLAYPKMRPASLTKSATPFYPHPLCFLNFFWGFFLSPRGISTEKKNEPQTKAVEREGERKP
ncbi:hypothetical protein V8C35DRAFT_312410 [Trichoderma chlorosporum]